MTAHLRRGTTLDSCVTSTVYAQETGMQAQNVAIILKPLVPNPNQPLLHIMQHVADYVAPFPRI